MELTPEQLQQQEILQNKATSAWGSSPHDAVEGKGYSERLTRTRTVYVDAYMEGYRQCELERKTSAGSFLTFADATALQAVVNDLLAADTQAHKAADAVRKSLALLIASGRGKNNWQD